MALTPNADDPKRREMLDHKTHNPMSWQGPGTKEQRESGKKGPGRPPKEK